MCNKLQFMHLSNVIQFPHPQDDSLQEALRYFCDETADTALEKLISLIDSGNNYAYAFVGSIYEIGGRGVKVDYSKALFYYEKSIEEVNSVLANQALGRMYYYGLGVEKDYKKSLGYYQNIDDEMEDAITNLMLGKFYYYGNSVDKDLEQAKLHYMKAIALGNVHAITRLAILESDSGNIFTSVVMRLKALYFTIKLMIKNSNDIRLRYY